MNRECVECHRIEPVGGLVASGGLAVGIEQWPPPEWRCPDCRAKYPEPIEYVIACVECEGDGEVTVQRHCRGCDHECEVIQECFICDGTGQYATHDCNPGCDHSSISGSLPIISASRGGIQFFDAQ